MAESMGHIVYKQYPRDRLKIWLFFSSFKEYEKETSELDRAK